jgi:hypothetical protein
MSKRDGWYEILLDGRLAVLVQGYKDAMTEARRLRAQHPGAVISTRSES